MSQIVVAISQTEDLMSVILANPVMINAYRAGVPGNGKHFPDGSKMAKIHWKPKKSVEAPAPTMVPDTGGWGYAEFDYVPASDTFTPLGSGTDCGYACHTIVKAKDYVFTAYPRR